VTVVTLVVGWLWQQALERDRAEREARVTRTIIIENAAGASRVWGGASRSS
jgi:two-component system, OmpR family, sensor kinase